MSISLHIINLKNTYQFNVALLPARHRPVRQLETPGARRFPRVLRACAGHGGALGYGSVLERVDRRPYTPTARAFFFKVSYLAHL